MPDWYIKKYIDNYDQYIFNTVMGSSVGVRYEPIIVATTETKNGTLYRYICKFIVSNTGETFLGIIDIFKPYNFRNRDEKPYLMQIIELNSLNLNSYL